MPSSRVLRTLVACLPLGWAAAAAPSPAAAVAPPAATAPCAHPTGPPGWAPDVAAARAYAATRRHAVVGFSVRAGRRAWHHRADAEVPAASVAKAVLLVAELHRLRDRPLPRGRAAELGAMVRRSDDVAATRVRDRVGHAAFGRAARRGAMRRFRVHPVWGLGTLTARDGARLLQRMARVLPARHRAFGLRLLRTVVPEQRWGVAAVVPAGWTLHFKGGWGRGTGAVEHQAALLTRGCLRLSLAIVTTSAPSRAHGRATLREVARRLLAGLPGAAS